MEPPKIEAGGYRSVEMAYDFVSVTPETSSFTALLELPPPQAVELLVNEDFPVKPPIFPSNVALIHRASKFSVFAENNNNNAAVPKLEVVKQEEPLESSDKDSLPNSSSSHSAKRKDREIKVKEPNKKSKKAVESEEKLPYVHVRARRGQATDSHSLAERARREKINARMKLLQELVPGCDKISGTAMVLDEIINHVQALQRQVEFLSMRLAAVNPRIDFNLDALLAAEGGISIDNSYPVMLAPLVWPEGQVDGMRQQLHQQFDGLNQPVWTREEDNSHFITPENSLLSYDSPPNSGTASLHSSHPPKMEL